MTERSKLIEWLRGDLIGPSRPLSPPVIAIFNAGKEYLSPSDLSGPLVWHAADDATGEEVLYYDRESPHRKYGSGRLHPSMNNANVNVDDIALNASDTLGADLTDEDLDGVERPSAVTDELTIDESDDFEVSSPDVRHPSVIGISVSVTGLHNAVIVVKLPRTKRFSWQSEEDQPFRVNGIYETCQRVWSDPTDAEERRNPMWRRKPAVPVDCEVRIPFTALDTGSVFRKPVVCDPLNLSVDVFPRIQGDNQTWLLTVVLRNQTNIDDSVNPKERTLFQSYFEVHVEDGQIVKYPESQRSFDQLDEDERSLALLYRDSATFGIGHGCSAGWDSENGINPKFVYADVLPTVELPSMTPEIMDGQGNPLVLTMRELANINVSDDDPTWNKLLGVGAAYKEWIRRRTGEAERLEPNFRNVALNHLAHCTQCLSRIQNGIQLLQNDPSILKSFQLANLAMLLQQIGTKQIRQRSLEWNDYERRVTVNGVYESPWHIYETNGENDGVGKWRAFQIAFLLMSLEGVSQDTSLDREIVDLIWFPTGGGKTEAYLGVMAFYMFHQRIRLDQRPDKLLRDGTNVLMRYTLRMLTTQQFQRAASLICAMEFLRRRCEYGILGNRFSLGLWIGSEGSPNNIQDANEKVSAYRRGDIDHNPLLVSECPWCRAEIGRLNRRPRNVTPTAFQANRVKGIVTEHNGGPLLLCPDNQCIFGTDDSADWLPIEVIDERIYLNPPSLIIGTVDKFALLAYRPEAGALFGLTTNNQGQKRLKVPPGIIIQDELHLISGPLGTMYSLYEGIFERLCTHSSVKPKIIASTATIRGASSQVRTLYARRSTGLFPPPGLEMGDSFFGTYARKSDGSLANGRLYLGIHASEYGSVLTTQVRAFSAAVFRPTFFEPGQRDPWWTLLAFYNSLRELGGAKTLFDSDIRSRLKFMFNRENVQPDDRRPLRIVEELTSRLSQPAIVEMMEKLSNPCTNRQVVDACLASNIIEVGIDIDRLSFMGVVGQPKSTSTYIQVTGRVGRRWQERPGLVLTIYNPGKSRDRSHFEQFHSYHRRLYERVEPTTATPFAISTLQRALAGVLITWARQNCNSPVHNKTDYDVHVEEAIRLLTDRSQFVETPVDHQRTIMEMERLKNVLSSKWDANPQSWEAFPQSPTGEYLILWPGQFATQQQKSRGVQVPSSMRQVDSNAKLSIRPE
jgi:hypothetical protein